MFSSLFLNSGEYQKKTYVIICSFELLLFLENLLWFFRQGWLSFFSKKALFQQTLSTEFITFTLFLVIQVHTKLFRFHFNPQICSIFQCPADSVRGSLRRLCVHIDILHPYQFFFLVSFFTLKTNIIKVIQNLFFLLQPVNKIERVSCIKILTGLDIIIRKRHFFFFFN